VVEGEEVKLGFSCVWASGVERVVTDVMSLLLLVAVVVGS
jgi:hypothetical protein